LVDVVEGGRADRDNGENHRRAYQSEPSMGDGALRVQSNRVIAAIKQIMATSDES
jgi:hypothetical protein